MKSIRELKYHTHKPLQNWDHFKFWSLRLCQFSTCILRTRLRKLSKKVEILFSTALRGAILITYSFYFMTPPHFLNAVQKFSLNSCIVLKAKLCFHVPYSQLIWYTNYPINYFYCKPINTPLKQQWILMVSIEYHNISVNYTETSI